MPSFKKLIFAPFFIIFYALLLYNFASILKTYDVIFSLSFNNLFQAIFLSSLFCLTSLFFVLFATISNNWKMVVALGLIAAFLPMLFLDPATGLVLGVGGLIAFILNFVSLENRLKSYLTFDPFPLLGPSIRGLITFLILVFSFVYFLNMNQTIASQGFEIPDSIIDASLKFSPQTDQPEQTSPQLSIPKEQLELLRQNPQLLKQSGLDPKILDSLNQPKNSAQNLTNSLIKTTVKNQLQNFLKPYEGLIPGFLTILFFFSIQSLASIINLLIYPLLWVIFKALEKTNFIKFEIEQRPVKKLVI